MLTQNRIANCVGFSCAFLSRNRGRILLVSLCALCLLQLVLIAGCHRGFYRRQADADARRLILEKRATRWDSATGDINIDPMSRMFDPFSADHPPIPPDDPTAHKLLHNVDRKPGYPHWHANGDINTVENPVWRSYLPTNEDGQVILTLSDAYQLALIHSPDLQSQRETLYLSALEVSIQRFGFDSQLFAGFNNMLTTEGRFRSPTGDSSTTLQRSLGVDGNGISATRLGITGASFVVGLANTILWEFAGNNTQSANSLINFSLIQPLLRDAGRDRILESLTQSERTLLSNVRQLERFRRGFYLEIATGRDAGAGPSATSAPFLNSPGLAGSNVGGYLGLLQDQQQIKNLEFSVAQFESLLKQFRELFNKDRIDSLQVAQFEISVYNQQESLLDARNNYQNDLDSFKVLIGIPPDVEVVIEDPLLDGFELIDDQFPERLESIKVLREDVGNSIVKFDQVLRPLCDQALDQEDAGKEVKLENKSLDRRQKELLPFLVRTRQLVNAIKQQDRQLVQKDIDKLNATRGRRLSYLKRIKQGIDSGRLDSQVEPNVFTEGSVPLGRDIAFQLDADENQRSLLAKINTILSELDDRIERINDGETSGLKGSEYFLKIEDDFVKQIPDILTDLNGIILEMALLQATARTNTIEVPEVDVTANAAFETARCFRRDWMNARTALVDSWRQIEFFADQLESQVDLVLTGEIGNAGSDNPFRLSFEDGNLSGGFQFDAPIVRQAERNEYRAAQISYQQARRSYYQFADSINQSLRQTIRSINRDKILFELNRQNLQVNIKQVQLARANLVQPPRPGQESNLSDVTSRNLTDAIQGLTSVQNRYLSIWTEYEVLRRSLDFDMGTMELDAAFEWVDPGRIDQRIGWQVAARAGIAENDRFCCGLQHATAPQSEYLALESEEVTDSEVIEPELPEPVEVSPPEPAFEADEFDPPQPATDRFGPPIKDATELPTPKTPALEAPILEEASSLEAPAVEPILEAPLSSQQSKSPTGFLDPFGRGIRQRPKPRSSKSLTLTATPKIEPLKFAAPVADRRTEATIIQ